MPFMNITPLHPEHVEPLARALYRQWHNFAPWSSMEKIRTYYAECLNGENLPLAFAAIGNGGGLTSGGTGRRCRRRSAALPRPGARSRNSSAGPSSPPRRHRPEDCAERRNPRAPASGAVRNGRRDHEQAQSPGARTEHAGT